MFRSLPSAAMLIFLAACSGRGRAPGDPMASEGTGPVTIVVDNRSYSSATLHLFRRGERTRLGTVEALNERTFRATWSVGLDMQLNIRLLAGPSCLTRPLPVAPGETVEVTIENNMERDMDCVRVG